MILQQPVSLFLLFILLSRCGLLILSILVYRFLLCYVATNATNIAIHDLRLHKQSLRSAPATLSVFSPGTSSEKSNLIYVLIGDQEFHPKTLHLPVPLWCSFYCCYFRLLFGSCYDYNHMYSPLFHMLISRS